MNSLHAPRIRAAVVAAMTIGMLACGLVQANAVSAEHAAGGLAFKPSTSISMTNEDLYLSMRQVRVAYVFHSSAAATQDLLLAFPMPVMPVVGLDAIFLDETPGVAASGGHHDPSSVPNYLDFNVRVNDQPVTTQATGRALLHGRDVTRLLQDAGMPLVFAVDADSERAAQVLPAGMRAKLVAEGLLVRAASLNTMQPDIYVPQWEYQTVFEWRQAFAPGDTRVEIAYAPVIGDIVDIDASGGKYPPDSQDFAGYCIDDTLRRALARHSNAHWDIATLGYVVTTANYWNGPINRFHLVVEKPSATALVAFCPLDAKKVSPTRFEWMQTDHVPTRDIKVMFFTSTEIP